MTFEEKIVSELKARFNFKSVKGAWLQQGKCPDCNRNEVYCSATSPKVVKCSREDRCGWSESVKSLLPELFEDWSKSNPATPENPTATADAYLSHERGLDLMGMRGAYTQELYKDQKTGQTSSTVRFALPNDSWWERIIDRPGRFDRKARFRWRDPKILEKLPNHASRDGLVWRMPDHSDEYLATVDQIWIAEGIFDAWALNLAFKDRKTKRAAVGGMSVNNWPEHFLQALRKAIAASDNPKHRPTLVFAYDVGAAGVRYTKKFVEQAKAEGWEALAAQVRPDGEGRKLDWNDLWLRHRDWKGDSDKAPLSEAAIEDYLWNGAVTIAPTPIKKAKLLYERRQMGRSQFWFRHNNVTWWCKVSFEADDEDNPRDRSPKFDLDVVANCAFRILYHEFDPVEDRGAYYLQVDFPTTRPTAKARFSSNACSSSGEFKKRMMDFAAMWAGTGEQLDRIMTAQTRELKTVEPIKFTGYSPRHGAWVLGDIAVHQGRVLKINSEDYFDIGNRAVKIQSKQRMLDIQYDPEQLRFDWIEDLWTAWGPEGLVSLAFFTMSLFAVQIRKRQASIGFLEITGEPGSGKTTLIEFLWKLFGRTEYEGFDPNKGTASYISRKFMEGSGMPTGLIEGNRGEGDGNRFHGRQFDWNELLVLYNGRNPRGLAVKTSDNQVHEPPFLGTIYLMQNLPIDAMPAVLERIMPITIDKARWSPTTTAAAERIANIQLEDVSGTIIHLAKAEDKFLPYYFERFEHHKAGMAERIKGLHNRRCIINHSQLAATVDALDHLFPKKLRPEWLAETIAHIDRMALARQQTSGGDHPVVAEFWEKYEHMLAREDAGQWEAGNSINLSRKAGEGIIAISLTAYEQRINNARLQMPAELRELRKLLKHSKSRKFIASSRDTNTPGGAVVSCYVFEAPVKAGRMV
ncbi:MAG: toprim domain-containing protein [Sphingomonadaceae bacterium]|nr:toprim domain-containing protein [Sphingomonadaceae bacterium]